jgi:hypothetical protein
MIPPTWQRKRVSTASESRGKTQRQGLDRDKVMDLPCNSSFHPLSYPNGGHRNYILISQCAQDHAGPYSSLNQCTRWLQETGAIGTLFGDPPPMTRMPLYCRCEFGSVNRPLSLFSCSLSLRFYSSLFLFILDSFVIHRRWISPYRDPDKGTIACTRKVSLRAPAW